MKTLDEVIKANECCDHGEMDSRCEDCPYNGIGACCAEREIDALHYLKHLQEYYNMSRTTAKKGWNIIVSIDSADMQVIHTAHRGPKLSGFSKADLGKTWKAYRKERG